MPFPNPLKFISSTFAAGGRFLKSLGERRLMSFISLPNTPWASPWNANRQELPNHFKGWSYVAITAIAEEIGGNPPIVAYKRSPDDVAGIKQKALSRVTKSWTRRDAMQAVQQQFWPRHQKALTRTMPGDELEPAEENHRLARLLRNPNKPDTAFSFGYKLGMYLEIFREAYIWCVPDQINSGKPAELWILPTHWMTPVSGETDLIDHYECRPTNGYTFGENGIGWFGGGGGGMRRFEADEIIQIAYPSPSNFMGGHSPFIAGSSWVECSESIESSRVSQFKNAAMPGVVVEIDAAVANPSQETIDRLRAEIEARYIGVKKTGKPMILAPGAKLVPVTHAPSEMDYTASAKDVRDALLSLHRVGASIVGLSEQTNFASMVAARANFHQSKISPMMTFLGQVLTEKLAPRFEEDGETLVVFYKDLSPNDPQQQLAENQAYLGTGVKAVNEVRTELGLEPYEHGGDNPMVNGMEQPWATGEVSQPPGGGMDFGGIFGGGDPGQDQPVDDGQPDAALGETSNAPPELPDMPRIPSLNGKSHGRNGKHVHAK